MNTNISFVIPCFNCSQWLAEAVASIMATNWATGDELVLVNDGSTDDTQAVCDQIVANYHDRDVKVIRQSNKGCGESRNIGNSYAQNDLIYAFDSDNVMQPNSVARLRDRIAEGDVQAVSVAALWFFRNTIDNRTGIWHFGKIVEDAPMFLSRQDLPTSSGNYLYKRSLWDAVPHAEGVGALEAWTWGLRTMMTGAKLATVSGTHYWHRQGIDSLWIRDSRTVNFNELAQKQMERYKDKLDKPSRHRLEHDAKWYDGLGEHPLKLLKYWRSFPS